MEKRPRKPLSPEARKKISDANKGKKLSAETRAKCSASHKGKKLSAEQTASLVALHTGRKRPQKTREKMSASFKANLQKPEFREAIRLGLKKAFSAHTWLTKVFTLIQDGQPSKPQEPAPAAP